MRGPTWILLLAGQLAHPALALADGVTVRLEAQNNSGQYGTASLWPEGSQQTKVVIALSNAPPGMPQPAHIHRGSCDKLDKAPRWSLNALKDGKSVTLVPVSLETILRERTAINVHKSAIETQVYVACGNIERKL